MSFSKLNNAIIVFAKLPVDGKVKTRLAEKMGDKFAVSFYKFCAEHTFDEVLKLKQPASDLFLFYSEESELEQIKKWASEKFSYYSQKGNDLGEKMYNAFRLIFNSGYKNVVLIGTDIPDINYKIIEKAFSYLETADCVLGPASDGGYYLLGLKSNTIDLFSGIEWSGDSVLKKTIKKLKHLGISYFLLDKLIDIDTQEDLKLWLS